MVATAIGMTAIGMTATGTIGIGAIMITGVMTVAGTAAGMTGIEHRWRGRLPRHTDGRAIRLNGQCDAAAQQPIKRLPELHQCD
ncbi:hypothetical protein PATSB16_43650 [Pandoraea thiooxydans]|nr:hypothetical protein PATSB16_43650 [Pandoraea thiooxydans]